MKLNKYIVAIIILIIIIIVAVCITRNAKPNDVTPVDTEIVEEVTDEVNSEVGGDAVEEVPAVETTETTAE